MTDDISKKKKKPKKKKSPSNTGGTPSNTGGTPSNTGGTPGSPQTHPSPSGSSERAPATKENKGDDEDKNIGASPHHPNNSKKTKESAGKSGKGNGVKEVMIRVQASNHPQLLSPAITTVDRSGRTADDAIREISIASAGEPTVRGSKED